MMRRPRKTPPLQTWLTRYWRVELHRQRIGYVVWALPLVDPDGPGGWEWSAFGDREDAVEEAIKQYNLIEEAI